MNGPTFPFHWAPPHVRPLPNVQKTTPALRSSSARDAAPGKHGKWPIASYSDLLWQLIFYIRLVEVAYHLYFGSFLGSMLLRFLSVSSEAESEDKVWHLRGAPFLVLTKIRVFFSPCSFKISRRRAGFFFSPRKPQGQIYAQCALNIPSPVIWNTPIPWFQINPFNPLFNHIKTWFISWTAHWMIICKCTPSLTYN